MAGGQGRGLNERVSVSPFLGSERRDDNFDKDGTEGTVLRECDCCVTGRMVITGWTE